MTTPSAHAEVWFLTGSQELYGPETLDQVAAQSQEIVAHARRAPRTCRSASCGSRCCSTRRRSTGRCSRPTRDADVRRRDRLDAHVLPGEDVDRRPRRAAQAAAAPAHAGQHGAAVVDDRHGLHEPQPGRPRRPGVRLHPDPPRRRPQDRRRPRQSTRSSAARIGDWARAALGPRRAAQRCELARFGDNMRDVAVTEGDKVEAQLRFGVSVNTYGVNDLVAVVDAVADDDDRQAGRRVRRHSTTSRPSCCPAADRHESLRYGARIELGLRPFLDRGRLRRLHHELRGPRRAAPAPRPGRAAADGRRLRLRRRGRLEDLGAAAHDEGDGRRPARRHVASWRTTPTTWSRARRRSSARTCSRSARRITTAAADARDPPAVASAAARTRCGCVFTADPGRGVVVGLSDLGDRFRLTVNEIDVVEPDEALPQLPVACAVWKPRPSLADVGRVVADGRGTAPHRAVHGRRRRGARGLRRDDRQSSCSSSTPTPRPAASSASCAGTRRTTGWRPACRHAVGRTAPRP